MFSLLPIFLTVQIGRLNDRGYAEWSALLGAVTLVAGALILWRVPVGLGVLLAVTAILGVALTLLVSSLQLIAMISSSRAHRDSILGNYMVAMSLGQAIGPLFLGLGDWVFPIAMAGALLTLATSMLLLRATPKRRRTAGAKKIPLSSIAATRGLPWIILTGALCVTALDLMLAFLPVLGEARGLAPATVGILLSVRALASMASRVFFGQAVRRFGRMRLMRVSVIVAGAAILTLALPVPLWVMAISLCGAGFGLGIALTSTIALTVEIAPSDVRGTALSLRLTANRLSQFGLPLLAGLVVGLMGAGGIFALTGGALLLAILSRPRGVLPAGQRR